MASVVFIIIIIIIIVIIILFYASIYPQNGKPYLEWNMYWALFKRQYKQHMEKKWLCEILHIAGLLNSENPMQIQTETFIKHVLPAKVKAINRLNNTNHGTRKRQEWGGRGLMKKFLCVNKIKKATSIIWLSINTTLLKDAILNSKFKSVPSIPCS